MYKFSYFKCRYFVKWYCGPKTDTVPHTKTFSFSPEFAIDGSIRKAANIGSNTTGTFVAEKLALSMELRDNMYRIIGKSVRENLVRPRGIITLTLGR